MPDIVLRLPVGEGDYFGRQCPHCRRYFKVRLRAGHKDVPPSGYCPYCGEAGGARDFETVEQQKTLEDQIENYAQEQINKMLMKFHNPRGPIIITPGRPKVVRVFPERHLENHVTCPQCALDYAVYGKFGFCPDCRMHNTLQVLQKNLDQAERHIALAEAATNADDIRAHLGNALSMCVSALDGFGGVAVRLRAAQSTDPAKAESVSFQNLPRAAKDLRKLFALDLKHSVGATAWTTATHGFQKRHLIAHRDGVVDQKYLDLTHDKQAKLGQLVPLSFAEVRAVGVAVRQIGESLLAILPPVP